MKGKDMLGSARNVSAAIAPSAADRTSFQDRAVVSWRGLAIAALLALLVGAVLFEGLLDVRSSGVRAVRYGSPTHEGLSSLPVAAQGMISATLGADDPAYRVSASANGFRAQNPAQRLHLRFASWGVQIASGNLGVGLSLSAMGYGRSLESLGRVTPRVKANRLLYERTALSEWYANGPLGLEQGFSIARTPSGHPAGPLTLAMALSGDAQVSLASGGQSLTLHHAGSASLRYTGLTATDARGRTLHTWLELQGGRLLLRVNTRGARYPLRIDPFVFQAKLAGNDEAGSDHFGTSVALSADGNTALVGSGPEDSNGPVGYVWVFSRSGSGWSQHGPKLTGSGESGRGEFGRSVALSADGNTALIGGPNDSRGHGAAWVFTRSDSTWTQQGPKLTATGESGAGEFGQSVALSADGDTVLIGGPRESEDKGAAWVFTRSGSTWTQQGPKLTGAGEVTGCCGGGFGASVALSADGNTALVGRPVDNEGNGAAWVFIRSGSAWTQQGEKLTAGGTRFGSAVALSADGNTALIGGATTWVFTRSGQTWTRQPVGLGFGASVALSADGKTALIGHAGVALVYTRSGQTPIWQAKGLAGTGQIGEETRFGSAVALSADGETALIGGPLDDKGAFNEGVGAAWVFARTGSTWTQQGEKLTGEDAPDSNFGTSVALSADGNTALIGAPDDNKGTGAAWVFTRSGSTWTQQGPKLTGEGEIGVREFGLTRGGEFGSAVALSADGNTALIGGPRDNGGVGAAWVFTRSGSTWTEQGAKLTGGGEIGLGGERGSFGAAVALSASGNAALIGGPRDNRHVGAAWVFTRSGETWIQQGPKLTGGGENGEGAFGAAVALSANGNTALIGGPTDNTHSECPHVHCEITYQGAAWFFTRSRSSWTQQGEKLTREHSPSGIALGYSVALSANGKIALIGGPEANKAWVFSRSRETWTELAGEAEEYNFGNGVALSADANTAVILGQGSYPRGGYSTATAFAREGSTWTPTHHVEGPEGEGLLCGAVSCPEVALSGNGDTAVAGGFVFVSRPPRK
jgi:hypothetical protein